MSANSGPIQPIPPGFLSLLQLKNLGRLPDVLIGQVAPSIDMEDWWLRATAQMEASASVTTASGGAQVLSYTVPVVVPDDEAWWVESLMVDVFVPAAAGNLIESVAPIIIYNRNAPLQYGFLSSSVNVTGVAGSTNHNLVGSRGFWLPPSSELGIYCGRAVTATTITFTQYLRVARLTV